MPSISAIVNDNPLKLGDIIGDTTLGYNPRLKRICNGDLKAGLVLNQLHYWWTHCANKTIGFYKTIKELSKELDLSVYAIGKSIKILEKLGYIRRKIKKLQHKTYFLVDDAVIKEAMMNIDSNNNREHLYRVFNGSIGRISRNAIYDIPRNATCRVSGDSTCESSGDATCHVSYKEHKNYKKNYSESYTNMNTDKSSNDFELTPDNEQQDDINSNPDHDNSVEYAPTGRHKKCPWSENWVMPDKYLNYAASKGLIGDVLDIEIEKFINYWISGNAKSPNKSNWEATWRNWVLNWYSSNAGKASLFRRKNEWNNAGARFVQLENNLRVYGINTNERKVLISVLKSNNEWKAPEWQKVSTDPAADALFEKTIKLWSEADNGR